jgi:hypothetical protein
MQFLNGFPVVPFGQKQIGCPASNSHIAPKPHGFGMHGFDGGLQPICAFPSYPGGHLHCAL